MCKKQNNIYVVEVNMTEKTVEEIAREAALKIMLFSTLNDASFFTLNGAISA